MKSAFLLLLTLIAAAAAQTLSTPAMAYERAVRITTGAHTVSGWETNLVKGNPNLSHWNWSPITSYSQGCARIATPGAEHSPERPLEPYHYVKPVRVATAVAAKPTGDRMSAPTVNQYQRCSTKVNASLKTPDNQASTSVQAKPLLNAPAAEPTVAVYGQLSTRHAEGVLCNYDVHAQLRSRPLR